MTAQTTFNLNDRAVRMLTDVAQATLQNALDLTATQERVDALVMLFARMITDRPERMLTATYATGVVETVLEAQDGDTDASSPISFAYTNTDRARTIQAIFKELYDARVWRTNPSEQVAYTLEALNMIDPEDWVEPSTPDADRTVTNLG